MISYIKVKNFKSFGDIYVNFKDKALNNKNLVIIYGENGIGKSNFTDVFDFLSMTLDTMNVRDLIQQFMQERFKKIESQETFINSIKDDLFFDMEQNIKKYKMVECDDPMTLEYGFRLNDDEGTYIMKFDDKNIIYESLEYRLQSRKGKFFDINQEKVFLSPKVFSDIKESESIKSLISQYWGKHTFLSILNHELDDKADHYYDDKISDKIFDILELFNKIRVLKRNGDDHQIKLNHHWTFSVGLGTVRKRRENFLDHVEKTINAFLVTSYEDIVGAHYEREYKDDEINYELYIDKNIFGKERTLRWSQESTGVKSSVNLMLTLLDCKSDDTLIIDEFDTGIHDLLIKKIIEDIAKQINGQIILTTHNTGIMESDVNKDSFYVINRNEDGNKEIECILKYDNKINPKTNIRRQYLKGRYKGIPDLDDVSFDKVRKAFEK